MRGAVSLARPAIMGARDMELRFGLIPMLPVAPLGAAFFDPNEIRAGGDFLVRGRGVLNVGRQHIFLRNANARTLDRGNTDCKCCALRFRGGRKKETQAARPAVCDFLFERLSA